MKKYFFEMPMKLWKSALKKAKSEDMNFAQLLRKLLREYIK